MVAVPKPNGGVRPIAIGEIYRRLTAKCLLEEIRPDARRHFWPVQTGVCVPAGVDAAVHTVRAWANRDNNCQQKVLVKLDFHNAFNTIRPISPPSLGGPGGVTANPVGCALAVPPWLQLEACSRATRSDLSSSRQPYKASLRTFGVASTLGCSTWTMGSSQATWRRCQQPCSTCSNGLPPSGLL